MIHIIDDPSVLRVVSDPQGGGVAVQVILPDRAEMFNIPMSKDVGAKFAEELKSACSDLVVPTAEQVEGLEIPGMPKPPPNGGPLG